MIQAAVNTAAQAKGTTAGASKLAGAEGAKGDLLSQLEGAPEGVDFAGELAASLAENVEVKPVEISAEQLLGQPTSLIQNLPQANTELASPKVFDPSLTKGVEQIITPQAQAGMPGLTDEQVMALANGQAAEMDPELAQALLKQPQVTAGQPGRAPAIDLAKSEVDPQLLNMDDFVAQKNAMTKKLSMSTNAYGMKTPAQQKLALENGLKSTEVVGEAAGNQQGASKSVNSQQFILDQLKDAAKPNVTDVRHVQKVFDMNHVKTDNPNQIMNQITDYIVQAKAAKEPTVSMRVSHDELGLLDITVRKGPGAGADAVAINIGAHTADGKSFFQQNSKDLFAHLSQAGINVADLKVETPSQSARNDFGAPSQQQGSRGDQQFGSESNQRRHEQDRRKELWNLLNGEAA